MSVCHVMTGWDHADLLDRILDKGIVLDSASRLELSREDLSRPEDQVVVCSADTYLEKAA